MKTLEDFEKEALDKGELVPAPFDFDLNTVEFRESAIEDVKRLEKEGKKKNHLTIEYLKQKFNIKKRDLK